MVFRLTRSALIRGGIENLPENVATAAGNYDLPDIVGAAWRDGERGIFKFGPRNRHCFVGYVTIDPTTAEGAEIAGQLDQFQLGTVVRVSLQPLTPRRNGKLVPGYEYIARPRLTIADYALTDPRIRQQLRLIGCPAGGRNVAGY